MITPTEIKQKAENKYYFYLQSVVNGESFFPIVIPGKKKPDEDTVRFEKELIDLINHSKEKKGYGYTIDYQTVKTKKHGSQDIPVSIIWFCFYNIIFFWNKCPFLFFNMRKICSYYFSIIFSLFTRL